VTPIIPYLIFPGTCRRALEFYADALGGEILTLTTFADAPVDTPSEIGDRVFDSEFAAGDLRLKASDDMPGHEVEAGTNFSLFAVVEDEEERARLFERLSEGGAVLFPLDDMFGMVADRFGIRWMIASGA
jgi:PhnB protein